MNPAFLRKLPVIGGLTVLASFVAPSLASAQVMLKGAGATFPYPVYSRWFSEYQKQDVSVSFEYGYIGSGGGQKEILARKVDFGASDAPLSDEQLAKADGKILHIPTVAGAVVVACNVPGGDALVLNGEAVAALFMGNITRWNDPRIAQLNPGTTLPDMLVSVVHRADDSGTTAIFTEYLAKVSPEWKDKLGHGKSVAWPIGRKGKGTKGWPRS
ncbi:MAG TPA: phosphate ABC transporter substrate-binding protein PstS [Verrucomicrobium sp.]|nr:phosphate ABC transporter substrate-binding protein PstS [Verrucomicrobium sp.]